MAMKFPITPADGIYLNSSYGGTISVNNIHHNTARGIFCDGGSGYVINRNRIEYNNTGKSYEGGGISCSVCSSTPTIANNFIRGNGATKGGGIYCYQSAPHIYNNTIVDNSCSISGDGIYIRNLDDQDPYVCNNIVANTTAGYGMYIDNSGLNCSYTVYLNKNCTYQNGYGNYAVSGNYAEFEWPTNDHYDEDPELSSDRCHLASGSQCIEWGSQNWNGIPRYYGPYDIDGDSRIINSKIDVGCDEVQ